MHLQMVASRRSTGQTVARRPADHGCESGEMIKLTCGAKPVWINTRSEQSIRTEMTFLSWGSG
jgi:hypothetical protein